MVENVNKCQFNNQSKKQIIVSQDWEWSSRNRETAKALGITFLIITWHLKPMSDNFVKIANQKVGALNRLSPFLSTTKKLLLMNAFFKCQFSYYPLIWMFQSRHLENKINRLQERCLRIVYTDIYSTFEDLLVFDGGIKFHERALQLN